MMIIGNLWPKVGPGVYRNKDRDNLLLEADI